MACTVPVLYRFVYVRVCVIFSVSNPTVKHKQNALPILIAAHSRVYVNFNGIRWESLDYKVCISKGASFFSIDKYLTWKLIKTFKTPITFFLFEIAVIFIIWQTKALSQKLDHFCSVDTGCSWDWRYKIYPLFSKFSLRNSRTQRTKFVCFLPMGYWKSFGRSTKKTQNVHFRKTNIYDTLTITRDVRGEFRWTLYIFIGRCDVRNLRDCQNYHHTFIMIKKKKIHKILCL